MARLGVRFPTRRRGSAPLGHGRKQRPLRHDVRNASTACADIATSIAHRANSRCRDAFDTAVGAARDNDA